MVQLYTTLVHHEILPKTFALPERINPIIKLEKKNYDKNFNLKFVSAFNYLFA